MTLPASFHSTLLKNLMVSLRQFCAATPTRAYPYIRGIVLESNGTFIRVSEEEIREARKITEQLEGIPACFTSSVAVAGLAKLVNAGKMSRDSTVLVNITGSDLRHGAWHPREPTGCIKQSKDGSLTHPTMQGCACGTCCSRFRYFPAIVDDSEITARVDNVPYLSE